MFNNKWFKFLEDKLKKAENEGYVKGYKDAKEYGEEKRKELLNIIGDKDRENNTLKNRFIATERSYRCLFDTKHELMGLIKLQSQEIDNINIELKKKDVLIKSNEDREIERLQAIINRSKKVKVKKKNFNRIVEVASKRLLEINGEDVYE